MEFYLNKSKSDKIFYVYYGILTIFLIMLLFSSGLVTAERSIKGIAISTVSILLLAIVLIKSKLARRDKRPMLVLGADGIISRTTPMSKAAGLMRWEDITGINLIHITADTLIELSLCNASGYLTNMKKSMPAFVLKDIVDADGILTINLTASELDIEAAALFDQIKAFASQRIAKPSAH